VVQLRALRRRAEAAQLLPGRRGRRDGAGHAAEDGAALHFVGSELERVVTSRPRARAYRVEAVDGAPRELRLRARSLRDAPGLVAA
jgi:hypothetical protein